MPALRIVHDEWRHRLSLVVRFVDHFAPGAPEERATIADELHVTLDGRRLPVRGPSGELRRQGDGTYRFVDLDPGEYRIQVTSPTGHWTRWEHVPPLTVHPSGPALSGPALPVVMHVELWPTTASPVPPGVTALRAVLDGPAVAGLRVELEMAVGAYPRHTFSDHRGELLFVVSPQLASPGRPLPGELPVRFRLPGPPRRTVQGESLSLSTGQTQSARLRVDLR